MKCVQIYKSGIMNELNLSKSKLSFSGLPKFLMKHSKSQGNGDIKELYKWSHNKNIIKCFSWYDGEAGFENKHDLPPGGISPFLEEDSSVKLLYGDIFLCKLKDNKYIDFAVTDYGEFYNNIFEGFDNCETETDEEDRNTESEDEDYKQPKNVEESDNEDLENDYEIVNDSDNELTFDENEY